MKLMHSRALVIIERKVINTRFDATEVVTVDFVRNDGRKFRISEAYGVFNLDGTEHTEDIGAVEQFCKRHSLPNFEWCFDEFHRRVDEFYNDPMTRHYGLSMSDVGL